MHGFILFKISFPKMGIFVRNAAHSLQKEQSGYNEDTWMRPMHVCALSQWHMICQIEKAKTKNLSLCLHGKKNLSRVNNSFFSAANLSALMENIPVSKA